jgi:hypothetical protein
LLKLNIWHRQMMGLMSDMLHNDVIITGVGPKSLPLPPPTERAQQQQKVAGAASGNSGPVAPIRQHVEQSAAAPVAGNGNGKSNVVIERPAAAQPRVRADVPTGKVEIPAFLRRLNKK